MVIRKIELETVMNENFNSDDWLVYGHSDILKTNVIGENENDLVAMFNNSHNYDEKFKQVFYLFTKEIDENLWNNNQNYNFVGIYFVTLNTTDNKKVSLNSALSNMHELKKTLKTKKNKIVIYDTLDNYDGIIVCNGNSPDEIEKLINSLFNKMTFKNIYKLYLSSYHAIKASEDSDNFISANIEIVLKSNNKLDMLENDIINFFKNISNTDYNITQTSGSAYLNLNIRKIKVKDFFSLFKNESPNNGLFSLTSRNEKKIIQFTRVKFLTEVKAEHIVINDCIEMTSSIKKIKNNLTYEFENCRIDNFYKGQLNRIIYATINIIEKGLPDYSMLILYPSLAKFIEKINSNVNYKDINECIRYFLEAAREIMNISDIPQIGYYTMQSYICKEVYAPSKLITFYSSFLWKVYKLVKKFEYDNEESNFNFCLTPSLKSNVSVKGIFLDDGKIHDRLLIVYIPMENLYSPNLMMFSLCHEAGHYICENIRFRNLRFKAIKTTIAYYLIDTICEECDNDLININKTKEKIIEKFYDYVKKYYKLYDTIITTAEIEVIFKLSIRALLIDLSYDILSLIEDHHVNEDNKNYNNIIKDNIKLIKTFKKNINKLMNEGTYIEMIKNTINIYSESFSDLLAIKLLKVKFKDYLSFIKKSKKVNSLSQINNDLLIIRLLGIYMSMHPTGENIDLLEGKVKNIYYMYKKEKEKSENERINPLPSLFYNFYMIDAFKEYLLRCYNAFNDDYYNETDFVMINTVFENNQLLYQMENFINDYRYDIMNSI